MRTTQLIRYSAAKKALAAATRVDEVKDIRDKAVAMMAYAAQAKDTELIGYATEIRYRAERKGGALLIELRENGGRQKAGDASGGNGSRPQPLAPRLDDLGVTKTQSSRWQGLARLPEEKFEEKLQRAKASAENSTTSAPRYPRAEYTGEVEWYTPREYVDLVREVLGEIDLDPASSAVAQETVKATNYFTKADDGLSKEWRGRVFLNPPYAQPHIANFMQKMVEEHARGRVAGAVMVTNNSTDTEWFALGAKHASAICFTTGRIKFIDPHGERSAPTQGQAFFYFGNLPLQFKAVFETIGFVVMS